MNIDDVVSILLLAVGVFVCWREKRKNPTWKGTYLEQLRREQTPYLERLFPHIGRARQVRREKIF